MRGSTTIAEREVADSTEIAETPEARTVKVESVFWATCTAASVCCLTSSPEVVNATDVVATQRESRDLDVLACLYKISRDILATFARRVPNVLFFRAVRSFTFFAGSDRAPSRIKSVFP